jgi:hypothetical protein
MSEFKAHDWRRGPRLVLMRELGPTGLSRLFASGAEVGQRDAQSASAGRQDNGVCQQSKSVQIAEGGRPRTIDGRFGKRNPQSASALKQDSTVSEQSRSVQTGATTGSG